MSTIDQFLFGDNAIIHMEPTRFPSEQTRIVLVFQNTSRLSLIRPEGGRDEEQHICKK